MTRVIFAAKAEADSQYPAFETENLFNLMPEYSPNGVKLWPVAGERLHYDTGYPLLADLKEVNEELIAVAGARIVKVAADATATEQTIEYAPDAFISGNLNSVVVASNGKLWVWGDTFAQADLSGAQFQNVGSAGYLAGYSIATEKGGNRFMWSALRDATSWPALNWATAEADTDNIQAVQVANRILVLFGGSTTELWAPTGGANENAFAPLPGGVVQVGLLAPKLQCLTDAGIFFIGDDNTPYMLTGAQAAPWRHSGVMSDIEEQAPDRVFYTEDRGQKLVVIRFPDRPAWVGDIAQRNWFRRGTGDGAWASVAAAKAYGKWFAGRNTGQVLEMARTGTDFDGPLVREATSQRVEMPSRQRFRASSLEFFGDTGDEDADLMVATSEDCRTFSDDRILPFSRVGKHGQQAITRNLGSFRQFTARIRMTDPVDMPINAEAEMMIR